MSSEPFGDIEEGEPIPDWDIILPEACPLMGETHGRVHILRLREKFSLERVGEIREAMLTARERLPWGAIAFDISNIPVIPTILIGTLVAVTKDMALHGRRLCLCGASELTDRTLRLMGLDHVFVVCEDIEKIETIQEGPF